MVKMFYSSEIKKNFTLLGTLMIVSLTMLVMITQLFVDGDDRLMSGKAVAKCVKFMKQDKWLVWSQHKKY
jgi:competence protein ComGC